MFASIKISTLTGIHWWKPAAWLRVTGADAAAFLQGQFTNELRGLGAGGGRYGLWLNVKGRVVADSFVLSAGRENELWVGSYFSPAATIRERLENFIVADDVVVADVTSEWAGVCVMGEGATLAPEGGDDGFVFRGRRGREENVEWVFPARLQDRIRARFGGVRELDAGTIARRRIEAAIPAVPADIGPGDLPNEGALEADAISYTKGCYLGQEVMARLKSMGRVRRRLRRVRGPAIPVLPAPLFAGARAVGELRSAAGDGAGGFVGLAMVSFLHVAGGTGLAFSADGPPVLHLVDSP